MDEKLYQLALTFVAGVGNSNARQLISYCGSAKAVFHTPKSKILKIPGIGPKLGEELASKSPLKKAELELEKIDKSGIHVCFYTDNHYPARLKTINDAPIVLYSRGQGSFEAKKTVSIVGTRNATDYGNEVTEQIVKDLTKYNTQIISGLAYGIDIAAHRAALSNGLETLAVMASGVDFIYPSVHRKTADEICDRGLLVSENSLGQKPDAHLFPARNRIIAGMADVILVVEAAEKGGALITAEIGFSYDKDVMAVPGNINNKYSKGCNKLLAEQKATIYNSIDDLEKCLNWDLEESTPTQNKINLNEYPEDQQTVIRVLSQFNDGLPIDEIAWKSQLRVNEVPNILLMLEFEGVVKALPGKKFKVIDR